MDVSIRPEEPSDRAAVSVVNRLAFARAAEGRLVDRLRDDAHPLVSFVAAADDALVGHALFSPVTVTDADGLPWDAMALGPMAVVPDCQRQGVGSQLVRAGLEACCALDHPVVFVLGHPEYYPRFGFRPAADADLRCEWDVPREVFMVLELEAGALGGRGGLVRYHAAFAEV